MIKQPQLPLFCFFFKVNDALDSVGLADQARVQSTKLSGGQKRKLSVAIAIIGDPKVQIFSIDLRINKIAY